MPLELVNGRTKQRWVPPNVALRVRDKQRLGEVFLYEKKGQTFVLAYAGNAIRPDFHYPTAADARLESRIKSWFAELRDKAQRAADYRRRTAEDPMSRHNVIATIKKHLRARGYNYSVTGGRGTAWGWIHISLLPSDEKLLTPERLHEEQRRMAAALGLDGQCANEIGVPASNDYYREYIERAQGLTPTKLATPYWD
jgi:hypothetical protein